MNQTETSFQIVWCVACHSVKWVCLFCCFVCTYMWNMFIV